MADDVGDYEVLEDAPVHKRRGFEVGVPSESCSSEALGLDRFSAAPKRFAAEKKGEVERLLNRVAALPASPRHPGYGQGPNFLRDAIPIETAPASIADTPSDDATPKLIGFKVRTLRDGKEKVIEITPEARHEAHEWRCDYRSLSDAI